ncbi:MAG TPA: hypothetical protein VGE35_03130 [Candidatus Paceibacterota bacterium]
MDTLSQLFGSALRVKLMRLFLFNKGVAYDVMYIEDKTGARAKDIEKEVASLKKMKLVKGTSLSRVVSIKFGKKTVEKKKTFKAWTLDSGFEFTEALTDFLIKTHSLEDKAIVRRLDKVGRIKAVLVSGIFMRDSDSRIDMFVVADALKQASMDKVIKSIESDMGKEIRYAVMSAADFEYRLSMNDKLVRDVLDFPHKVLSNKIGIISKQ